MCKKIQYRYARLVYAGFFSGVISRANQERYNIVWQDREPADIAGYYADKAKLIKKAERAAYSSGFLLALDAGPDLLETFRRDGEALFVRHLQDIGVISYDE